MVLGVIGADILQNGLCVDLLLGEVVLICWKLEAQWDLIGLLLWALNPFKMILFWGLKKFPLRREFPTLKDHLSAKARGGASEQL